MTGTAPRPRMPRRLVAGALTVLVGLVSWVLYGVSAGAEKTSFHPNGNPPQYVHLTAGKTYWLAVPGGVARLRDAALRPSALNCTAAVSGQSGGALPVSAVVQHDSDDTKFVNRIASFQAARTGRVHVDCEGIGPVYVENADDSSFDWSGLFLVLASAALVVGLPLVLSGLRRPTPLLVGPGEQHEVE